MLLNRSERSEGISAFVWGIEPLDIRVKTFKGVIGAGMDHIAIFVVHSVVDY